MGDHVTSQVAPMVRSLPGVAGAVFLIDRAGGAAMTSRQADLAHERRRV